MLGFSIKSTVDVMSHLDAQLGLFEILESCAGVSSFKIEEYKVRFAFGFINDRTWKPVAPNSKKGDFLVEQSCGS